jgi:prepilin peptidase CpaA
MTQLPPSYQILLVVVVTIAAVFDIRFRRIPNWLVLSGLVLGLALNSFLFGTAGAVSALLGCGAAFLVYFPLFIVRGMGAGDVKLMMTVGCIAGPGNWIAIFFFTSILGGVWAVLLLLRWGVLRQTLANAWFIVGQLAQLKPPYGERGDLDVTSPKALTLPHGATIAVGTVAFMLAPLLSLSR